MRTNYLRYAIVLGLVSAIGPFAIDMYLPALPTIGADLGASDTAVQMSLVVVFLSFAVGPLLVGPLADMHGRKPVLYGGLIVFALASIGAALSPTVSWLIFFRLIQGLGASTGMVVPRAIVRDLHTGPEAAKLMSLLMLVFSVSPILAPLTGSFIIEAFGWRAVFWAVTIAAVLGFVLLMVGLKETRPAHMRGASTFTSAWGGYRKLLRDRNFLGLSLIGGLALASFFVYLANSSFVIIDHYGMSPSVYSLYFSVNAISFFTVSQASGWAAQRFGLRSPDLPSILITHQVFPFTPIAQAALRKLNLHHIARFDRCWIMDEAEAPGLAGDLSHGASLPSNARYIGTVSRMQATALPSGSAYRIVAVISGPEPHRTLLETILTDQLQRIEGSHLLVRGMPGVHEPDRIGNLTRMPHLAGRELAEAMAGAELIVSRSGYTTLMDLVALGRSALVIPTPGQAEQVYLGELHSRTGRFIVQAQDQVDLQAVLGSDAVRLRQVPQPGNALLERALDDLGTLLH